MFKHFMVSIVLVSSVSLAACATNPYESYSTPSMQTQGAVAGGVIGGLLGSTVGDGRGTVWATAMGTLIGALAGAHIGRQLDNRDRYYAGQTLETVPTGATKEWVNPDSGTAYSITPTHTYESRGAPCREFTMDAEVGGHAEQVYGTACRQADGSWKMSV